MGTGPQGSGGGKVTLAGGAQIDAFGRLRVSEPATLFDSKQLHDNAPLLWDDSEVSGSGTSSSHSTDQAMTTIGVSLNTAGNRVRQTFMRFNYQPGKSQQILMTGVLSVAGGGTGITRCMGYYDDNDGVFMRDNEGTVEAVCRSNVTGTPVNTAIAQSAWNLDRLDGTGPSGITLNPAFAQIVVIDLEWLGVGTARIGFVIDSQFIYVHQFLNANAIPLVYMSTPNLPLRYEISNDGTGAASTLGHICGTVISEGGQERLGTICYASTSGTHVDCNVDGTLYAIIGLRLKTTHLDQVVSILKTSLSETAGNNNMEWVLMHNPTVASTFTYSDVTNASVQRALGATANTVTGGTPIGGGHFSSGTKGGGDSSNLKNVMRLGAAIDGTRDTVVLCARPVGSANADIEGALTWQELT